MAYRQPKPDRETPRVSAKIAPAVTKYYLKTANRYRAAQLISILLLLLYLFFVITTFGNYITYDNMQYLIRDFDSMISTGESEFSRISYNRQGEQTFAVFKNGIAAAGKESVNLYDSTGLLLANDRLSYTDPVLVPSEKYLLLYDMGGKGYSVYNSVTRVISRTEDYKIVDGDMSDSGAFILVTRSGETRYVVKHFNNALSHTMKIYKDNYVMDTAISEDGQQIVICSAVPSATDFDCEIAIHTVGSDTTDRLITLSHTMPLSVCYGENGFTVLCDNGLYFYDKTGEVITAHSFAGMTPKYADLTPHGTVLAAGENALGSENRILVFDGEGNLLRNAMLDARVLSVCTPSPKDDALAYVLTSDSVFRLCSPENEEEEGFTTEEAATDGSEVIAVRAANKGVIVCTALSAYYLFN